MPLRLSSEITARRVISMVKQTLVHGRKVIIHWPHAKFLPLINISVNQPPEVIIHC